MYCDKFIYVSIESQQANKRRSHKALSNNSSVLHITMCPKRESDLSLFKFVVDL